MGSISLGSHEVLRGPSSEDEFLNLGTGTRWLRFGSRPGIFGQQDSYLQTPRVFKILFKILRIGNSRIWEIHVATLLFVDRFLQGVKI